MYWMSENYYTTFQESLQLHLYNAALNQPVKLSWNIRKELLPHKQLSPGQHLSQKLPQALGSSKLFPSNWNYKY